MACGEMEGEARKEQLTEMRSYGNKEKDSGSFWEVTTGFSNCIWGMREKRSHLRFWLEPQVDHGKAM